HLTNGARASRQDGGVAVVTCGGFAYDTRRDGMMIAARDQGGPSRAAQRGGVEAVVSKTLGGKPVHGRRRHTTSECTELAEAGVVDEDQYYVRRAPGRLHGLWKLRRIRVQVRAPDIATEMGIRTWQFAGRLRRRCRLRLCLFLRRRPHEEPEHDWQDQTSRGKKGHALT